MRLNILFKLCVLTIISTLSVRAQLICPTTFEQLKCITEIPNPLVKYYDHADTIKTQKEWLQYRPWIKKQAQHWILGYLPPAPNDLKVIKKIALPAHNATAHQVVLGFNKGQAKITARLYVPNTGHTKHPVIMSQWNHEGWLAIALRRGYAVCLYAAADAKDDTKNYKKIFNSDNMGDLIARTYGAMRVVDYLHTQPQIDTTKIGILGHSRNGKQSLFVAAFDERVDACIISGGGVTPMRLHEPRFNWHDLNRTLLDFPNWFSPNLNKFVGMPHKLPVDFNSIIALIAPRACLYSGGFYDKYADSYGMEMSYASVKPVYKLFGAENKLDIRQVVARHTVTSRDVEEMVDFFDTQFGINNFGPFNNRIHTYNFNHWHQQQPQYQKNNIVEASAKVKTQWAKANPNQKVALKKQAVSMLTGTPPPAMVRPNLGQMPQYNKTDHITEIIRQYGTIGNSTRINVTPYNTFGDYQMATLYLPNQATELTKNLPVVLYLHDYFFSFGYGKYTYPGFSQNELIEGLINRGYAVVALDLPGFGSRQMEVKNFYKRYPDWSLVGKMIAEIDNALAYIKQLPITNPNNLNVVGQGMGATLLSLTNLEKHNLNKVVMIDPFHHYYKTDDCYEGIEWLSKHTPLMPRLGYFINQEAKLPFGLTDLLQPNAAKNTLLTFAMQSRHTDMDYLNNVLMPLKNNKLQVHTFNHIQGAYKNSVVKYVVSWMWPTEGTLANP